MDSLIKRIEALQKDGFIVQNEFDKAGLMKKFDIKASWLGTPLSGDAENPELKYIQMAKDLKQEGNNFFKAKDYRKAISKYCRVYLFLKGSLDEKKEGGDPALAMAGKMQKSTLTDE